ncbi:cytochrome P450, partial [Trifolium medium]|nr:cytochrome P450 [Trifolium medium]
MIKSVLQAIPSYVMSVYLLPDSTIKEIEHMINSFWWGGGENNKGIKWLAWDRMTFPKALWRWIIGNGTKINVMRDPWLREKDGIWVQSPQLQVNRILDIPLFDEEGVIMGYNKTVGIAYEKYMLLLRPNTYFGEYVEAAYQPVLGYSKGCAGLETIVTDRLQHFNTVDALILDICRTESKDVAGQLAVLLWIIWNNRNNKVWNAEHETGRGLGIKARQFWLEWKACQSFQHDSINTEQHHYIMQWQKPPPGWNKCNVDAGFHNELNKTSLGWILRDQFGQFVMAGTSWNQGKCSIIEGEAIALLEAMKTMEQRGMSHVIFETDSRNVVDAIHNLRI